MRSQETLFVEKVQYIV